MYRTIPRQPGLSWHNSMHFKMTAIATIRKQIRSLILHANLTAIVKDCHSIDMRAHITQRAMLVGGKEPSRQAKR
jgi:hypothetical protein